MLFRLGRDRQALPRFENLLGMLEYEEAYLAPRHLRLAQIHERGGQRERAAERYRGFLALWGEADPPLGAMVREARARLAALAG